jgi:hypothetical protein
MHHLEDSPDAGNSEFAVLRSKRQRSNILTDRFPLHNSGMAKLPLPDEQPIAVKALRNRRSRSAGEVEMYSREIDRLRAELVHLDATMRLFHPETSPSDIPALRRYPRRTEWFARGEVTRLLYEAFRRHFLAAPSGEASDG